MSTTRRVGDYIIIQRIDGRQNEQSKVFLASYNGSAKHIPNIVVLKEMKKQNQSSEIQQSTRDASYRIQSEIVVMKTLNVHPNISQLYNVLETADYIYMVLEWIDGDDLFEFLNRQESLLPRSTVLHIFKQVIEGLLHCTKLGIVHRDIKLENIMRDKGGNVKMIDFGFAAHCTPENKNLHTFCGSPHYVSPELLSGKYFGIKSDVWSLGVILYALNTLTLPFKHENMPTLGNLIKRGEFSIHPKFIQDTEMLDLIKKMLNVNVEQRIDLDHVASHPLFNVGYFREPSIKITVREQRGKKRRTLHEGSVKEIKNIITFDSNALRDLSTLLRLSTKDVLDQLTLEYTSTAGILYDRLVKSKVKWIKQEEKEIENQVAYPLNSQLTSSPSSSFIDNSSDEESCGVSELEVSELKTTDWQEDSNYDGKRRLRNFHTSGNISLYEPAKQIIDTALPQGRKRKNFKMCVIL
jgi:serine/threonine protein kinase